MHRALLIAALALAATDAFAGAVANADMVAPSEPPYPQPPPPRRDRVRAALAKQRTRHLAALHAYRKRGVFAHAYDREGEVYVWRDQDGHLDAIPAMIAAEGKLSTAIVDEAAPQLVGAHLLEAASGGVRTWMVTSGFSPDELDRLQRPHVRPPVVRVGDTSWQADEDARLTRSYGAVESYLRAHTDDGLDAATDALMSQSLAAWSLVDPKHKFPSPPYPPQPPMPEPEPDVER